MGAGVDQKRATVWTSAGDKRRRRGRPVTRAIVNRHPSLQDLCELGGERTSDHVDAAACAKGLDQDDGSDLIVHGCLCHLALRTSISSASATAAGVCAGKSFTRKRQRAAPSSNPTIARANFKLAGLEGQPFKPVIDQARLFDPRAAAGAETKLIQGAGHSPNVEKPAETAALVLAFDKPVETAKRAAARHELQKRLQNRERVRGQP
jgi:pimeloyl-ACP methyl ester carboxylesterase